MSGVEADPQSAVDQPAQASDGQLDALARHHGIVDRYRDVWGTERITSARTQRGLLEAMDIACADAGQIADALAGMQRDQQRLLPPVLVTVAGRPLQIPVVIDRTQRASVMQWTVREERGENHQGTWHGDVSPMPTPGSDDTRSLWKLDLDLPEGYHSLDLMQDRNRWTMSLIVAPPTCYLPPALAAGGRWWGLAAQLYSVRHQHAPGMGDFGALEPLLGLCAEAGGELLGLNPLHALFPLNPGHASPYSPSTRLFLNVLYVNLECCSEVQGSAAAMNHLYSAPVRQALQDADARDQVDYPTVARIKLEVLERAFGDFYGKPGPAADAFAAFRAGAGEALQRHALFEALQAHFAALQGTVQGWRAWPAEYRNPRSPAVLRFAEDQRERVSFHAWLQWLADRQLGAAAAGARRLGMAGGLYLDLAVSVDKSGSETWANQDLYATAADVGAPPDVFSPLGQNWGLPPMRPRKLREAGYTPFIDTLRQVMRHAAAIRIDHVMGLARLYWIPEQSSAAEGAYVAYPVDDLLGIVALESQRNRCLVIGEDLGTVPPELSRQLDERRILSYRLLYFEQAGGGAFQPPAAYPHCALAASSTHDLPTWQGWWAGRDLQWRRELALFPDADAALLATRQRQQDREALLTALGREELLPPDMAAGGARAADATATGEAAGRLAIPVQQFLARTPSMVHLLQIEDALEVIEQVNLPGTIDQHPNWRQRLPVDLATLARLPSWKALTGAVAAERPRPVHAAATASSAPRATYRLQLHGDFTLSAARSLLGYLNALGISDCYLSPVLHSRAGSRHGYDIVDHSRIDPGIAPGRAYQRWRRALSDAGMGQMLDIVPNHMGIMGRDNGWWLNVLEHGEASPFSGFFDIDWRPAERALAGKVLLPVLGEFYGAALRGDDLQITFEPQSGRLAVSYFEHLFPLDPRTYPAVLAALRDAGGSDAGPADPSAEPLAPGTPLRGQLDALITDLAGLPRRSETSRGARRRREHDAALLQQRLADLYRHCAPFAAALDGALARWNATGDRHRLLERQAWRLAHWRTASDEINYRRFFDVNDLAGLRVEDPAVFDAVHGGVLELAAQPETTGLRIDHADGLYDPAGYFASLAARAAGARTGAPAVYLLAEKILAPEESLPEDWAIDGTTGYDFAALAGGLFVDPAGLEKLDAVYRGFAGEVRSYREEVYHCKHLIMRRSLTSELAVLSTRLHRIAQLQPDTRDFTRATLREALAETVACLPVYRTYLRAGQVSDRDIEYVEGAIAAARRRSELADTEVFDFLASVILQRRTGTRGYAAATLDFAMKLQQFTPPVMAKAAEDTAYYRYARLLSLNEVGDEPDHRGESVTDLHRHNAERLARWPRTMLASSTHDSKRSEDVRMRLHVLAELADPWGRLLEELRALDARSVTSIDGAAAPSANDQYFIYQTLVGSWPLEALQGTDAKVPQAYRQRLHDYFAKAFREAKCHTSWIAPNAAYESAVTGFVDGVLDNVASVAALLELTRRVAPLGLLNSLSLTLLKLCSPGVPDIYQGTELWDFSLVDPDNRRPVDYQRRADLLRQIDRHPQWSAHQLAAVDPGAVKLCLVRRLLALRRQYPALFERGDYQPLQAWGRHRDHVCAFTREIDGAVLLVAAPRLPATLGAEAASDDSLVMAGDWGDTGLRIPDALIGRRLRNVVTGRTLTLQGDLGLAEVTGHYPVVALCGEPDSMPRVVHDH